MTELLLWVLRGLEGFVLAVGSAVSYASLRAFRRTRQPSLAYLGAGFVFVSVAAVAAGIMFEVVTHDLLAAWVLSAAFYGAGFSLILYSIARPLPPPRVAPTEGTPDASSPPEGDAGAPSSPS